ncbi:MAG: helix-turn-helix domain-containing protein [Eubacteriales bacterium]|nr:helix-turn-helix domain-containing protein [Eubacteriales bacterium]
MNERTNEMTVIYESDMPPVTFRLLRMGELSRQWDRRLQLLYTCRGELELWVQGKRLKVQQNQVVALHPMEIYRVLQGQAVAALFQLELSALPPMEGARFQTLLTDGQNREADSRLRALLAEIIRSSTPPSVSTAALTWQANACRLLAHLMDYYSACGAAADAQEEKDGISAAVLFTRQHFTESLPLTRIAEIANYSVPYFSKRFSEFLGCSYTEYLTELRLQKARQLLDESQKNLREIAEECGFSDARALTRAWRQTYHTLPSDDRGAARGPGLDASEGNLQALGACLDALSNDGKRTLRVAHRMLPTVSVAQPGKPFHHSWQQSIGTGRASALLHANIQHMLSELQAQTPFKRAVLHGLLDDEMQVCSRDANGRLTFSFTNIDIVLDFLLSIRLEPLMQLGFMPRALAARTDIHAYDGKSLLSLPKEPEAWRKLVRALILHLFERYGRATVESWEFCLWSKPNNPALPFGRMAFDEYFEFYRLTYFAVKELSPAIVFGSPAFLEDGETAWLKRFFTLCRRFHCLPDRFRFDCYPMRLQSGMEMNISERDWARYNPDPNALTAALQSMRRCAEELDLTNTVLEVEEWNLSVSQRELLNDTCFKATYLVKNALENWELCGDIAYWAFFDNMGEATLSDRLFHGGLGLFTRGNIRKASYYAMWMLARLGGAVLAQGDGYVVTRSREGYQVLFYNYTHFSTLYADGESFDMSFTNRYTPFVSQHRLHCELCLTGMTAKHWQLISHTVNRRHGSSFDQWVKMGAQALMTREDIEYLQGISQPQLQKWTETTVDDALTLSVEMEPFEVRLVLLTEALEHSEA